MQQYMEHCMQCLLDAKAKLELFQNSMEYADELARTRKALGFVDQALKALTQDGTPAGTFPSSRPAAD